MPHEPGHTNKNTIETYKVYGTDEPYNGLVVELDGFLYATEGGALEGVPFGQQVVLVNEGQNINQINQTATNSNPVTRTFQNRTDTSGNREYIRMDGSPASDDLHEHLDGTIMEGHDPNDMGVLVKINPQFLSSMNIQSFGSNNVNTNQASSGGGNMGGTTGGSTGGGGGGY